MIERTCHNEYKYKIWKHFYFKVKAMRSKLAVQCERSSHKKCTTEIWKQYLFWTKSRKYWGIFKVKSAEKTQRAQESWSQQLEHKQVPKRDGARCPKGISIPCWHATFVENSPWKSLVIWWRSSLYQGHEIGEMSVRLGSHCNWSRARLS